MATSSVRLSRIRSIRPTTIRTYDRTGECVTVDSRSQTPSRRNSLSRFLSSDAWVLDDVGDSALDNASVSRDGSPGAASHVAIAGVTAMGTAKR